MDSTTSPTRRRVVTSVAPRLLSDSLATLLRSYDVDVVVAGEVELDAQDVLIVSADTPGLTLADVVVRLGDEAGAPTAVVDTSFGGPPVRVEGLAEIIAYVVDLCRRPGRRGSGGA